MSTLATRRQARRLREAEYIAKCCRLGFISNDYTDKIAPTLQPGHPKDNERQRKFLGIEKREALFGGAASGGKLLRLDAKILTPFGWKLNGDMQAGDMIVNPRTGTAARVIIAHKPQVVDVWRVFFSDGTQIDCGKEHLWTVKYAGRRNKVHNRERSQGFDDQWLGGYRTVTTEMLQAEVVKADAAIGRGKRANYPMIPVNHPVQFTGTSRNADTTWPVEPYLLGVMIGDGHMKTLGVTSVDQQIVDEVKAAADRLGGDVRSSGIQHFIRGTDLRERLQSIGLLECRSWEKFIPERYLFATLDVRQALMQGLMDTDGTVYKSGRMSYTTVSKQLADDVAHLARSLGALAKVSTKTPTYTHKGEKKTGRLAYSIRIKPHDPTNFFRLERKKDRAKLLKNKPAKLVIGVERVAGERAKMRCITVDTTDGLYITDDFIVTHNSFALGIAAMQYVTVPGYSALLLMREFVDLNGAGALLDKMKNKWMRPFKEVGYRGDEKKLIFPTKWDLAQINWQKVQIANRDGVSPTEVHASDALAELGLPPEATISFGYMSHSDHRYNYKSREYQFIGWDELTRQEDDGAYLYLFSRLRAADWLTQVPLRVRGGTNPGDKGGTWVRERFIPEEYLKATVKERFAREWSKDIGACKVCEGTGQATDDNDEKIQCYVCAGNGRVVTHFIPSNAADNKSVGRMEYLASLSYIKDEVIRKQLADGDWLATSDGELFKRAWIRHFNWKGGWQHGHIMVRRPEPQKGFRTIDRDQLLFFLTADTAQSLRTSADKTAIGAWAWHAPTSELFLCDTDVDRYTAPDVLLRLQAMGAKWKATIAVVEQASSGVWVSQFADKYGSNLSIHGYSPHTSDKVTRSTEARIMFGNGKVWLPNDDRPSGYEVQSQVEAYVEEHMQFPNGENDDRVDMTSMAVWFVKTFVGGQPPAAAGAMGGVNVPSVSQMIGEHIEAMYEQGQYPGFGVSM
jgi:phage terminase large subunit-like protein